MKTGHSVLTHWGRLTHVCVCELDNLGSGRRQKAILFWPQYVKYEDAPVHKYEDAPVKAIHRCEAVRRSSSDT